MKKTNFIVFSVIFIAIGAMTAVIYLLFLRIDTLNESISTSRFTTQPSLSIDGEKDVQGSPLDDIREYIDIKIASISGKTETRTETTIIEKTLPVSPVNRTIFIPMGNTANTTSTEWKTVEDTAVSMDFENDFGSGAIVTWSASLKVAHGNGQAFARLWDDTNKIAVLGSEISSSNNSEFTQASSGKLSLWRGKNTYKVQLKSLNSFDITYSNGKIKITHE